MSYPGFAALTQAVQRARTFDGACTLVVDHLAAVLPMGLWAVTRVVGDAQTMLTVSSPGYPIGVGAQLPYATSLCRQMVSQQGPPVIADISSVPGYVAAARAAAARDLQVRAYAGVPILGPQQQLFGTLCGYSPQPEPDLTDEFEPLLVLLASLLSALLHADLAVTQAARDVERARSLADSDELTGLLNRRGWTRLLELEEARYRRFGDPAGVVVLDLDNLKLINDAHGHREGDRALRETARILRNNVRAVDIVARLGGDEFGIITAEAVDTDTCALMDRLRGAFADAELAISMGHSGYSLTDGLHGAWNAADHAMYQDKQRRRSTLP